MDSYLLDTDICIFLLKNQYGIKQKIKEVRIDNCFVSEITIAELTYGAFRSDNYQKHIKEVTEITDLFGVISIYECINFFGEEKARLNKIGKKIPDFDLLIGATSVVRELVLVTNNLKHMSRIKGIKVENWKI